MDFSGDDSGQTIVRIIMPPKHLQHSPRQWSLPNTASEFVSSQSELDDSTGHDVALPLCSFDSSAISSGLPWDSQGFALGVSDETETGVFETQGLSLPSEPPELDLRDWILRNRAESPPREDSLDEISGAKEPSSQNSVKHHLTTASHRSRRGECEVPNVKEKWVFSRKNWEAVDEEEQVLLASETKKKQRTATSHQDDNCDCVDDLGGKAKPFDLNEVLHMKEESDCNKDTLLTIADSKTENAVAVDSEIEDVSETNNIVENRKEFPTSHFLGLDMNMSAVKEDSLQENSQDDDDDLGGRAKPYDLNGALHTKEKSDYNEDTSLTTADSETEIAVAVDSEKEDEPENNNRVESRKEFSSSHSMCFDMNMTADKKDSVQEKMHVSSPPRRRRRCSGSRSSLREPLSDCGNLVLHPQQSQHSAGKWLCPRTDKKHFEPPLKQLFLDRWLSQPK